MLKNRTQNVRISFFFPSSSFEKKVQDGRLNKCNLIIFFLLITLHTFRKTTIDYNLTVCVKKKGTATKLQTHIVAVFFSSSANCTVLFVIIQTTPQQALVLSLVNQKKKKKGRLHCNTLFTVYYLYIYIYIYLYHTGCNYDKIYS